MSSLEQRRYSNAAMTEKALASAVASLRDVQDDLEFAIERIAVDAALSDDETFKQHPENDTLVQAQGALALVMRETLAAQRAWIGYTNARFAGLDGPVGT